jgi:hypothetical protein
MFNPRKCLSSEYLLWFVSVKLSLNLHICSSAPWKLAKWPVEAAFNSLFHDVDDDEGNHSSVLYLLTCLLNSLMPDYKESHHKKGQQRKNFNVMRSQKERKTTH